MRRSLLALALVASLTACSDDSSRTVSEPTTTASKSTTAPTTTATVSDLVEGAPADEGMDATRLEGAKTYAFQPGKNTQGVVVVRHGTIVAEWYAPGSDKNSWAASWSMSKSVADALIGIAIDEGKIPSVDVPMTTYYPEWAGTDRSDITLRDVLEMSPGLKWEENYSPSSLDTSDVINMVVRESDQLAYAESRPAEKPPGTEFVYSSGTSMLLSGVLKQATGMEARDYAQQKLWSVIGVDQVDMWTDAKGHTLTYCCVDTTSRGFARFGQLFLDKGAWGSKQIVPESWVAASVAGSRAARATYGFQWWLDDVKGVPADMFSAQGHDGQFIYVVPSLDLVVVRNGTYVKDDGPPVADPTLFAHYPSGGLVPGKGTVPPDSWDDSAFLTPIVESISD